MMKKIYLVDYLGVHCGMHYYVEAFKQILVKNLDIEVNVLSNYTDNIGGKSFFRNQYKGNIISKGYSLLCNILKLKRFVAKHRESIFIYLTYGNRIDIPFIKIVSKTPNHIIDIHEAIAQNVDNNESLSRLFQNIYSKKIKNVISHSSRTDSFLKGYGYVGKVFSVPHFKYIFPKDFKKEAISQEIINAVDEERINFLFFGNLNINKGVDILIDAVNKLSEDDACKINVIIAGKDFDGAVDKIKPKDNLSMHIFKRHITDDELRFLYQNVDFIMLPYRKTSQSGILEMAFYFKKPIIASDIPYFRNMLSKFPSFGLIAGNTSRSFSDTIEKVVSSGHNNSYFIQQDLDRYNNRIEINKFIHDFSDWINKTLIINRI